MFETSVNNLWLIRHLQAAVPGAQAHSFSYEIYKRMPYATDLTVLRAGGLRGMNFAFIEGAEYYHTPEDDPDHLDQRSLQEQGRNALALAARFGAFDLRTRLTGEAVYFPFPPAPLVVYPASWAVPLAVAAASALVLAAWLGRRRRSAGTWIAVPLGLPALALLYTSSVLPGVSYLLEWPILAAAFSLGLLVTAPAKVTLGLRAVLLMLVPAVPFLLAAPLFRLLIAAFGFPAAGPLLVAPAVLIAITVLPQFVLFLRKSRVNGG
jgi:hypothetical protein